MMPVRDLYKFKTPWTDAIAGDIMLQFYFCYIINKLVDCRRGSYS